MYFDFHFQNVTSDANQTFHKRLSYFLDDYSVSSKCRRDLLRVNGGLERGEDWALRMVDAFGKPGANLMDLRFRWMGSYDECVEIKDIVAANNDINGKFCWIKFPFEKSLTPHSSKYIAMHETKPVLFKISTCFPATCSERDIKFIVKAVSDQLEVVNTPSELDIICHTSTGLSSGAIACLVMLFVLALLLVTGTAYDVIFMRLRLVTNEKIPTYIEDRPAEMIHLNGNKCQNANGSEVKESERDSKLTDMTECPREALYNKRKPHKASAGFLHKFCLAFSIIKNGEEVLEVKESKTVIKAVEGMRVLTISWVVLVHILGYSEHLSENLDLYAVNKFQRDWTLFGTSNPYSVDTFFAISGFLLAHGTLRKLNRCGGVRKYNWGTFYLFRFLRLTPTYYIVVLVYWKIVFGGYFSGPLWSNVGMSDSYAKDCDRIWWQLFLYVHNFAGYGQNGCLAPSWYLAADLQMYVFSPLILIPLFCFPKLGLVVSGLCIAGSIIYAFSFSWLHKFIPTYSFFGVADNTTAYYTLIHFYTFSHICSFVIGIITAYILYKKRDTIVLSRKCNLIGWMLAIGNVMAIAYLPFRGYNKYELTDPEYLDSLTSLPFYLPIFEGLARSLWSSSVCWMIFACAIGQGGFISTLLGWTPFLVLGRLTFSTYLIHEIVIQIYFQTRHTLYYFSDIELSFSLVAITVISYGAGFILSVCVEKPFDHLKRILFD